MHKDKSGGSSAAQVPEWQAQGPAFGFRYQHKEIQGTGWAKIRGTEDAVEVGLGHGWCLCCGCKQTEGTSRQDSATLLSHSVYSLSHPWSCDEAAWNYDKEILTVGHFHSPFCLSVFWVKSLLRLVLSSSYSPAWPRNQ